MNEIPGHILAEELRKATFVRTTKHEGNEIYTFSGKECPNLMMQVGILREHAFRTAGGGTGLSIDLDGYDEFAPVEELYTDFREYSSPAGFRQLIVWNPEEKEIIGGYRYAPMSVFVDGQGPTAELFNFSEEFLRNYVPYTIELGRSFVQPKYQNLAGSKFALDNLFDGLGALLVDGRKQGMKYFFGKVTMYDSYNKQARNMILYYFQKHFKDSKGLVVPKPLLIPPGLDNDINELSTMFIDNTPKGDKLILKKALNAIKQGIPPLFNKYSDMSPKMKYFGTAVNHHCGNVEETAIMIKFSDVVKEYRIKYIYDYINYLKKKLKRKKQLFY